MTPTLLKIRSAVHKAIPSILGLKFGCEVIDRRLSVRSEPTIFLNMTRDRSGHVKAYVHCGKTAWYVPAGLNGSTLTVVGRPIRLADVLATIDEKSSENLDPKYTDHITTSGEFCYLGKDGFMNCTRIFWNLLDDDLDHQSEEMWELLAKILNV